MASDDYKLIGGPHKGEAILFAPDGAMYVVKMEQGTLDWREGELRSFQTDWQGHPLTQDDVYAIAEQRFLARSLLARCLDVVLPSKLRQEIKAALGDDDA